MRKQFPILALLIIALLSGPIAHVLAQQRWSWSNDSSNDLYGDDAAQDVAGKFGYYALVLSWSPSYCADEGQDDDTQCNRRDGRRYSFVLHGLWPQYEHGYPSNCRLARRPFVQQPIIDSMLDIMPSQRLVIHEYRAHGTCSGLDPSRYFSTAHQLFDSIVIPERFRNPFESQFVAPSDIRSEFLSANPKLTGDMLSIVCGGSGKGLKEVRFCFSKDGHPRTCGDNENQRKLCSTDRVFIPPTRSTARDGGSRSPSQSAYPAGDSLPGPRMDNGGRAP